MHETGISEGIGYHADPGYADSAFYAGMAFLVAGLTLAGLPGVAAAIVVFLGVAAGLSVQKHRIDPYSIAAPAQPGRTSDKILAIVALAAAVSRGTSGNGGHPVADALLVVSYAIFAARFVFVWVGGSPLFGRVYVRHLPRPDQQSRSAHP